MPPTLDPEALLQEMVETPSLSGQERAISELLVRRMGDIPGMRAWRDEAGNAVGVLGDGPEDIVLLGHMDTVPGVIPVRREGDLLYGRGAVDAKGPLATFISAVAQVGPQPGKRWVIIGAVEEEAASSAGARHIVGRYHPAAAIIGEPSDWDRITLGYKGSLVAQYTVARAGEHSSGPSANAAEKAVDFWIRARDHAGSWNGGQPRSFATLDPALRAIWSEDDGLFNHATALISYRVPLECSLAELKAEMRTWVDEGQLTIVSAEEPFKAERNTALVRAFLEAIRQEGGRPRFALKHGTSDMNIVGPAWGCPMLAYGPGDSNLDHTPNEHISLAEYRRAIAVLSRVLAALAQ